MKLHHLFRILPAVGMLALSLALTACAMKPDPKYAAGKYFEEPYKSAAGTIWDGNTFFFKEIFRDKNLQVDHIGKGNWSLLLYSIACQNLEAMQFLLDQGADPNLVNPDSVLIGREKVHYPIQAVAYAANEDTKFLKRLLEAGGDPDSKYSTTPALQRAQLISSKKNIELLLEYGGNIEARDGGGVHLFYQQPICRIGIWSGFFLRKERTGGLMMPRALLWQN